MKELTEKQTVFLLELVFSGEPAKLGDLEPLVREPLIKQGLLTVERRKNRGLLHATDRTWRFVEEHLDLELRRTQPRRALRSVLQRLQAYLAAADLSLAEFVRAGSTTGRAADGQGTPVREPPVTSVRRAYLARSVGQLHVRVRLSDLRAALPAIDRATLDSALLELQRSGEGALFPLDDPTEITQADRDAALPLSGVPQHLLYLMES